MIAESEDALVCDFAETYHVFDWRSLPIRLVATLASGLRDDSRIKLRLAGERVGIDTMLRAVIADRLGFLAWAKTEDGRKGRKRPLSFVEKLTRSDTQEDVEAFDSPEAFEAARRKFINGG